MIIRLNELNRYGQPHTLYIIDYCQRGDCTAKRKLPTGPVDSIECENGHVTNSYKLLLEVKRRMFFSYRTYGDKMPCSPKKPRITLDL